MENGTFSPLLLLGAAVVGVAIGYLARRYFAVKGGASVEQKAKKKIEDAEERAKQTLLEAESKAAGIFSEGKKLERERQEQLRNIENRLLGREESLEKKDAALREEESRLRAKLEAVKHDEEAAKEKIKLAEERLEKLSGFSKEAAREEIIREYKEVYKQDLAATLQKFSEERQEEIEKKGVEIMTIALQRYARSHVSELTTTVFPLKDEELKGKIIGREGRNIRALERETGVEFVIDETPDSIVISSFDPFRREVARLSLEKLVKDGRIQPAKIEEKVEEARQELEKRVLEIGEQAATEVGVYDLPKEILQLLGRLHFRTSFGQNVLTHSIEMAFVAHMMASELGLNAEVAKKGALLHDIGKAIDHEVEGTHVELGRKILRKYGISEPIIEAMQSHHEEYPYARPEAFVVTAADVLSAARPGARRGTLENYVKRLGDLERIAKEFPGVKNAYAIAAGRELRIFVMPEKIDDFGALELARTVAARIQSELKYPGEIKVNVVREMRAVEYAR